MNTLRRPAVLIPVVIGGIALLAVGLYLFQPWRLITNVTVDEALPTASVPASVAAAEDGTDSAMDEASATPAEASEGPAPTTDEPTELASGEFISHEHGTTGTARILELVDGSRVLRIEGLDTSNGPDLKVWLTDAPVIEGEDGWYVFDDGNYVDLGALKGNQGNQNYRIPADTDLTDLTSVSIWCDRFSVSFGAAELVAA